MESGPIRGFVVPRNPLEGGQLGRLGGTVDNIIHGLGKPIRRGREVAIVSMTSCKSGNGTEKVGAEGRGEGERWVPGCLPPKFKLEGLNLG